MNQVGNISKPTKRDNPQRNRVYDPTGLAPTIHTMGGGQLEPLLIVYERSREESEDTV